MQGLSTGTGVSSQLRTIESLSSWLSLCNPLIMPPLLRKNSFRNLLLLSITAILSSIVLYNTYNKVQFNNKAAKRRQKFRSSKDLTSIIAYLYNVIEENCGGLLQNACVVAARKLNSSVLLFCSGGWNYLEDSDIPLPHYNLNQKNLNLANPAHLQALHNYWTSRSVGKSFIFNSSLALLYSIEHFDQPAAQYSYENSMVEELALIKGNWLNSSDIDISIIAEIGEYELDRKEAFIAEQRREPNLNSADLARVCSFATQNLLNHFDKYHYIPAAPQQSTAAAQHLQSTLWHQYRGYKNPKNSDYFIRIKIKQQFFYFNLAAGEYSHFDKFSTDNTDLQFVSELAVSNNEIFNPIEQWSENPFAALFASQQQKNYPLYYYARPHSSASKLSYYAPTPIIQLLTQKQFEEQGGREEQQWSTAQAIIQQLQDTILINKDDANPLHYQLHRCSYQLLSDKGLSTDLLYHKLADYKQNHKKQPNKAPQNKKC
jgi:hypothetical protein